MIERLGMIGAVCAALTTLLITGFLLYALWPYEHAIGTVIFVFVTLLLLLVLVEAWGFVLHRYRHRKIMYRVIAVGNVVAFVGNEKLQHLGAMQESAKISTYALDQAQGTDAKKSAVLEMHDTGTSVQHISEVTGLNRYAVDKILKIEGRK